MLNYRTVVINKTTVDQTAFRNYPVLFNIVATLFHVSSITGKGIVISKLDEIS